MLSPNRANALAATLDRLEVLSRSATVQVRVRTHEGATVEGTLVSVSRRQVHLSGDPRGLATRIAASDIAMIQVAAQEHPALGGPTWELWFDYGRA